MKDLDIKNKIYETESYWVNKLNDYPFDRWVEEGKKFVEKCEAMKLAIYGEYNV